eukprot:CAMPEP_0183357786 /NCGR_PEP_ID=MMETSP0164_2-20130417/47357_1 /TAXON_ID=221442 /ORGANISM="Coccolithus pelagicus ssp braarudi, Strain PLY182g" /LENGTH=271 /DNA_ID=CAMNT_0025531505 /DNA_START=23 /DNA_END=838 /DNA_ORIENTATION=+
MDVGMSLDDMISAGGRSGGRGRFGGSQARGRGRSGVHVSSRGGGGGGASRGITKRAPSSSTSCKVTVVGVSGGSQDRRADAFRHEPRACLIGPNTDIKKAAGSVAKFLREGTPPVVKAISPQNVNQAVKTLALARSYLADEGLDLYAAVDFPEYHSSSSTANVNLHIAQKRERTDLSRVLAQLTVSGSSDPGKVAGAIAKTAREATSLRRLCVSCAGPAAMLNALKAVFLARHYLKDDEVDLSIVPEFENVVNGPSLVHLFTIVHQPDEVL